MSEWFRLADAGRRIAQHIVDQLIDSLECLAVLGLSVDAVLPPVRVEGQLPRHASGGSRSSNSPRRARSIDASKRSALAGFRSKYAVSVNASESSFEKMTDCPHERGRTAEREFRKSVSG